MFQQQQDIWIFATSKYWFILSNITVPPCEKTTNQGSQLTLHELHIFGAAHLDGKVQVVTRSAAETQHRYLPVPILGVHVEPGRGNRWSDDDPGGNGRTFETMSSNHEDHPKCGWKTALETTNFQIYIFWTNQWRPVESIAKIDPVFWSTGFY